MLYWKQHTDLTQVFSTCRIATSCRTSFARKRLSPSSTCGLDTRVTWPRSPAKNKALFLRRHKTMPLLSPSVLPCTYFKYDSIRWPLIIISFFWSRTWDWCPGYEDVTCKRAELLTNTFESNFYFICFHQFVLATQKFQLHTQFLEEEITMRAHTHTHSLCVPLQEVEASVVQERVNKKDPR